MPVQDQSEQGGERIDQFIAKNIERIGDHATDVAENVWFVVHSEPLDEPRVKQDRTLEVRL